MASENKLERVLYWLYQLHMYTSKGEAFFKAGCITVAFAGAFWSKASAAAYYLFSISIVMEYLMMVINSKKFLPKLVPFTLVCCNLIVLFWTIGPLLNGTDVVYKFQFKIEAFTIIAAWIDVASTVFLEKPDIDNIEKRLGL